MEEFERKIRQKLKNIGPDNKVYLKKNYAYEIFSKHNVNDYEVDYLFDMKKIIAITQNLAFPEERMDAEINAGKNRKLKIIFMFNPVFKGKRLKDKVGIITAFLI